MSGTIIDSKPSLDKGYNLTVKLTLTTADTARSVAIPAWAQWVRIYSDKLIRISIGSAAGDAPPAAEPAKADANVAAGDLGIGAYCLPLVRDDRRIPDLANAAGLALYLLDDVGGAVVYIEFCRG